MALVDRSAPEPDPKQGAIVLRPPGHYGGTNDFVFPDLAWILGTWHVTHSTLAMWRDARNVRITYTNLTPTEDGKLRLDDRVEYEEE